MPASSPELVLESLKTFAHDVHHAAELGRRIDAGPEDQLKQSVPKLIQAVGAVLGRKVSILSESPVEDVGRPDLAIAVDGLLVGYIELKAPGEGTTIRDFTGRNKTQFTRFSKLPNLIYTDARDWTFYDNGERQKRHDVRLGDIDQDGDAELGRDEASRLLELLREFLRWKPIVPTSPKALAELLAPLTRMLRDDVEVGAKLENSALASVYADWKRTLFPDADAAEFADSYAQTVTYGILLARLDGAETRNIQDAARAIAHHSSLLARTLELLTQEGTREELGVGLQLLERTIEAVDPNAVRGKAGVDPWLYFYEDFLAVYDPKLRNERGVYYTPAQVVKAQVTLVDELLRTKLGRTDGVADTNVTVLDPALGTGTYLLQTLQRGIDNAIEQYGPGSESSIATKMAQNLYGFELLVGPYAVAHLRLTQAINASGGHVPADGVRVYLTDTLESSNASGEIAHSFFEKPLAEEHRRARAVKRSEKILVCIGNPPYEREEGGVEDSGAGSWIRYGDSVTSAPLESFVAPARAAGAGVHVKNLYNLYVYFWRWALWKVFETQDGPGIVSFITASSYLRGPGFVGVREEMRRTFDELWIIDLEGDSRGTRTTENVFDIRTPVAIAVGIRYGQPDRKSPAKVHYSRITGTREEKFSLLEEMSGVKDLVWSEGMKNWGQPLSNQSIGDYFSWPELTDLMPWQHSGTQLKRLWPIAEDSDVLEKRWHSLMTSPNRATLFRQTRDRDVYRDYPDQIGNQGLLKSINSLPTTEQHPYIVNYGYRTFDRQKILLDTRLGDRSRPALWKSLSERQIFLASQLTKPLGFGPGISASVAVPDMDFFCNRGGKDIVPLYRDSAATQPNVTTGLLEVLGNHFQTTVTGEDLACYVAGVLANPRFTTHYQEELRIPGPRIPISRNKDLFDRAVNLGAQILAWQTYAERFPESLSTVKGVVPKGMATLLHGIPDNPDLYPRNLASDVKYDDVRRELHIGTGVIGNVDPRVWAYEVSGLRVVRSWLGYRMRERTGKKSSLLDNIRPESWTWGMTKELLDLLHVLEGVIALEPLQAELLDEIVAGELFLVDELPKPTDAERQPPKVEKAAQLGMDI